MGFDQPHHTDRPHRATIPDQIPDGGAGTIEKRGGIRPPHCVQIAAGLTRDAGSLSLVLFNSYTFIVLFLPVAFAGFFACALLREALAACWLIGTSLIFYAW